MSNPDLTQDRELVELAKVMYTAIGDDFDKAILVHKNKALAMADAARTRLGSGYVLPEANEANAERLARAIVDDAEPGGHVSLLRVQTAKTCLRALHSAFCYADKPKPTCNATDGAGHHCEQPKGHAGDHAEGRYGWEGTASYNDILDSEAQIDKPRDAYADGERRRERQKLVWEAMRSFSHTTHQTCVSLAIGRVDQYLAWRDADEAAAKEELCRKK